MKKHAPILKASSRVRKAWLVVRTRFIAGPPRMISMRGLAKPHRTSTEVLISMSQFLYVHFIVDESLPSPKRVANSVRNVDCMQPRRAPSGLEIWRCHC